MDSITATKSMIVGLSFSALNPKNLALTIAAASSIDASLRPAQQLVLLIIYAAAASSSIIIPVVAYSLDPKRVQSVLGPWKDWLVRNNSIVMAVVLTVLGALIFGNGLKVLSN